MKASDFFVKCLESEGVKYVFALPGEENLDLIESIRKSKIKLIITRHEQAAAFMAGTYGRLTGKAGVCLSTLGPGALNMVTGIAQAHLGGMPLVAITGQKNVRENWQAKFQLIDVVSTMKPITKIAASIYDPRNIPAVVRQAFKTAEEEKPGAVHIELPEDVAQEIVPKSFAKIFTPVKARRPAPDPKAIEMAVEILKKAKNPLIILSSGGNRKMISKQLVNFVKSTGIFVTHTQMGKGIFPDDDEHSLFAIGLHRQDYVHCAIDKADVIIAIGYDLAEYPPSIWNKHRNKTIIHIDFRPAETEIFYTPTLEIVGDISHTLWQLTSWLSDEKKNFDFSYYKKLRKFLEKKFQEKSQSNSFPLKPQRIVFDARKFLGRDDILVLDNGIYKLWVSRLYPAFNPNTVLLDNALASMGAGLPSAIAAKLVHPKKKVLAMVGDGGFLMNSQELETAVRLKLNIVVLILNDNAYGFIKWKQKEMKFKRFGMDYSNPDFAKYAQAYGAAGYRVKKAGDLLKFLQKGFKQKGPAIIECPIDYTENEKVFTKELSKLRCP
ncbi:MAG: acetolactate synthase large subunit [Candidatus Diapherotrites archaeon]|nr:acetolactate synthase large subunit [Candidatus Diapherotrites archaeon]